MLFFLRQKTNIDQKGMLAAIFGDVGLDEVDDVWPNGGLHDIRERDVVAAVCSHIRLEHLNGDERVGGATHWWGCVSCEGGCGRREEVGFWCERVKIGFGICKFLIFNF